MSEENKVKVDFVKELIDVKFGEMTVEGCPFYYSTSMHNIAQKWDVISLVYCFVLFELIRHTSNTIIVLYLN